MLRVTCALIEKEGKVLITQRSSFMSQPLLWEFPGGKVEAGETDEVCLVREIQEELNLIIHTQLPLSPSVCTYSNKTIKLIPFICSLEGGEIKLLEHTAYKWASAAELKEHDWCLADIPVVEEYILLKSKHNTATGA